MRAALPAVLAVLLACARAQAQPASLALLDVPFIAQSEDLCGGAAAAMVLRYWGARGLDADSFAPLVDRSAAGIRTDALLADLVGRGWQATGVNGSLASLQSEIALGRPVIALVEDRPGRYHYVVVVGSTADAVVFHDPARAPLRVMRRADFDRRWRRAAQWMAIVLPGHAVETPEPAGLLREARPTDANSASAGLPTGTSLPGADAPASATALRLAPSELSLTCEQLIAAGVAQAQANDLAGAEQALTRALTCPGPAPFRELAGVRLLQRRWDEVSSLATRATELDPADAYAWQLLGASRFVQGDPRNALAAWNQAGQPRLDLLRIDGLERTRQQPVERLVGVPLGRTLAADDLTRAERALAELPSATSTRLSLTPIPGGLAELHAVVAERPRVPRGPWPLAALVASATANRTLATTFGSFTGSGEALGAEWRFWPGRERIAVGLHAPAPWSGVWGAELFIEQQEFDGDAPDERRTAGRVTTARWLTGTLRVDGYAGAERFASVGRRGLFGAAGRYQSPDDRVTLRARADGWFGGTSFASAAGRIDARSSTARSGPVVQATAGVTTVSAHTPLLLWPAGDGGQARDVLLRAHPVLDDGRLRIDRLGRHVSHATVEGQFWWDAPALTKLAAALFVDYVRTATRVARPPIHDVDVGIGARIAPALLRGMLQIDVARGLRDGRHAITARYVVE